MKKEIKFRMWDKENKEMWEVANINFSHKNVSISHPVISGVNNVDFRFQDVEIMQFTGLLDKNGKEIYEGDITKEEFNHGICNCEVIFEKGGYFIKNEKEEIKDNLHWHANGLEVIGNKFEDPNLVIK